MGEERIKTNSSREKFEIANMPQDLMSRTRGSCVVSVCKLIVHSI